MQPVIGYVEVRKRAWKTLNISFEKFNFKFAHRIHTTYGNLNVKSSHNARYEVGWVGWVYVRWRSNIQARDWCVRMRRRRRRRRRLTAAAASTSGGQSQHCVLASSPPAHTVSRSLKSILVSHHIGRRARHRAAVPDLVIPAWKNFKTCNARLLR